MPPVVIGGAIAAAGAVGAAAIGNRGASRAAEAQTQSNAQNVALQRDIYNQNRAALQPWQQSGLQANALFNAALGIGGGAVPSTPTPTASPPAPTPNTLTGFNSVPFSERGMPMGEPSATYTTAPTATTANALLPQQQAQNAFDVFRNSTGYQFRVGEGQEALNSGFAGAGLVRSGAALKALDDYRQNMASGEFANWMSGLESSRNLGFGAASAQAGVGQNYANNVSALNSQNANALAQLQLQRANNTAGAIGAIGQIGGYIAGRGF